jgi:hypothetical protein
MPWQGPDPDPALLLLVKTEAQRHREHEIYEQKVKEKGEKHKRTRNSILNSRFESSTAFFRSRMKWLSQPYRTEV